MSQAEQLRDKKWMFREGIAVPQKETKRLHWGDGCQNPTPHIP